MLLVSFFLAEKLKALQPSPVKVVKVVVGVFDFLQLHYSFIETSNKKNKAREEKKLKQQLSHSNNSNIKQHTRMNVLRDHFNYTCGQCGRTNRVELREVEDDILNSLEGQLEEYFIREAGSLNTSAGSLGDGGSATVTTMCTCWCRCLL